MVRRLHAFARVAVDAARRAALREGRRQQHVVDPQAVILRERELPVVPPAERHWRLLEQSEAVGNPRREELAECRALGRRAMDLPVPQHWIVHVAVVGRDVEIAGDRELGMTNQRGA